MRFAVHGPGNPVASPRSHGVSRRDVACRVHVGVAGETAGRAPEDGLALARLPVHVPARRAPLARERGSDLLHPARGLVLQPAYQQAPPRAQDPPVQPGLGRTFRPGSPRVPFADRVMLLIFRSSTRITSNRRASPVCVFSTQSLRRSLSRARSRAIACLTRPRRFEPRVARASVRCSRRSRSAPARSGRGSAAAPRWTGRRRPPRPGPRPPPRRCPAREPARGSRRTRRASARPGPGSPGRTSRPAAPRGTSGTAPSRPSAPRPGPPSGTAAAPPTARRARRSGTPRAARPCATTAARPGAPGRRSRHRLGEVPQRLLLHRLGPGGQPRVRRPRLGQLPALRDVARRAPRGPGASTPAARRPGSTRTGRGRSGPAAPLPGRGWEPAGTGTYEHTIEYRRHFRGGDAACPPQPEDRGLHAATLMSRQDKDRDARKAGELTPPTGRGRRTGDGGMTVSRRPAGRRRE